MPLAKAVVAQRFDAVARRYDAMQQLNFGYTSDLSKSAERLGAPPTGRILDLCCGTGLSTEALIKLYPHASIVALDASKGMLAAARAKPALSSVRFVEGDAHDPAAAGASGPFDAVFMAYGIRNMSEPDACLSRIRQLLSPGGVVAFHEYLLRGSLYSRAVWNVVAGSIIVPMGWAMSGSAELFRYLRRSVNEFDTVERFQTRIRAAGFEHLHTCSMIGWQRDIVHTVVARKASEPVCEDDAPWPLPD
jgi:ubiquinone/menaquinone biosynthesis methyltransferase